MRTVLLILPYNDTSLFHPLGVTVFKTFETKLKKKIQLYCREKIAIPH